MSPKTITTARLAMVGVVAGSVLLAGCSSGDQGDPGTGSASGGSKQVKKIGVMLQDISNPFFSAMEKSIQDKGKAEGVDVNVQDGRQDIGTQNDQFDTFIQQQVDMIIVNAVDSKGIASAVARAKAAGITVVAVDVDADGADAAVTTDNVAAGRQSCEALVKGIGGKGNVLIIEGTPTTAPQERVKGCEEVLAKNPAVKIVGRQAGKNDRASGLQLTTDLLTANKTVNGIFAINDPEGLGADLAVQQAGRTGVKVVGVDGSPEAVKALKDPSSNFFATPAQDPAGMIAKAFEVGKQIRAGQPPAQRVTLIEPTLVDRTNVAQYKGW